MKVDPLAKAPDSAQTLLQAAKKLFVKIPCPTNGVSGVMYQNVVSNLIMFLL